MTDTTDYRVELYLRGDTYGSYDRQQRVLERVEDLEAEGVVADTEVDASWQRIRTPEQDSRDEAVRTYEELREWATENGYRLEPAFQRRQRSYIGTDVVHDVVVFPMASLAVYAGSDLQAVFPCADESGEIHYSVQDCLDAFESGDAGWFEQFAPVTVDRAAPRLTVDAD
ncbi:HTH domain-containing protein [Halosimplex aquaticum]|uniref:HTH domain-containing protein n=1 Tax=Halosimplex aquaticum TaxID=3026162 RepID=A0ABD5Y583_9EURY|nr:HTH domain-containing protein [Halosimplex aquaticum]